MRFLLRRNDNGCVVMRLRSGLEVSLPTATAYCLLLRLRLRLRLKKVLRSAQDDGAIAVKNGFLGCARNTSRANPSYIEENPVWINAGDQRLFFCTAPFLQLLLPTNSVTDMSEAFEINQVTHPIPRRKRRTPFIDTLPVLS